MTTPRALGHLGISAPDVEAAVRWYAEVLGWVHIQGPETVRAGEGHGGTATADIMGPRFGAVRIARMTTAGGVGLELFEYIEPKAEAPQDHFAYWRTGIFHLAIVDPDLEGLTQRIVAAGGRQRSKIWTQVVDDERYRTVYCEDPWGIILKINSHAFEQTAAAGD